MPSARNGHVANTLGRGGVERTWRRVAVVATLVVLAVVLPLPAAGYDSVVVATDPADGAVLAAAPTAIVLTTAGTPDAANSHVAIEDHAGSFVATGTLRRATSAALSLAVKISSSGNYTVAYHIVMSDGRESVGAVGFSVGTAAVDPASSHVAHEHGVDPLSAVVLVADLVVLLSVAVLLFRRPAGPRRRPDRDAMVAKWQIRDRA